MTEVISKAFATIEGIDEKDYGPNGGFTAVLSTPSEDRDGDELFREEWKDFTQERYPLDMDHGMSVATTIGSFRPYFDGQKMMMEANFAGDEISQRVRGLVTPDENTGIRHIQGVSVAFMLDKNKKSGTPKRELLNAGVVCIQSNRDAVILGAKAVSALKEALSVDPEGELPEPVIEAALKALEAKDDVSADDAETKDANKPYGDVPYADPEDGKYPIDTVAHIRAALAYINVEKNYAALGDHAAHVKRAIESAARAHGIEVAGKSIDDAETKAAKPGAIYVDVVPRLNEDALKNVLEAVIKATSTASGVGGDAALVQAIHDASSHLGAGCPVVEVTDPDSGAADGANKELDQETFTKALDETLTPEESPADEEPAPDVKSAAASEDAAEVTASKKARERELEIFRMRAQSLT